MESTKFNCHAAMTATAKMFDGAVAVGEAFLCYQGKISPLMLSNLIFLRRSSDNEIIQGVVSIQFFCESGMVFRALVHREIDFEEAIAAEREPVIESELWLIKGFREEIE